MALLLAIALDISTDIQRTANRTDAHSHARIDKKYQELKQLIHSSAFSLDELRKGLSPLFELYKDEVYEGKMDMNSIVEDAVHRYLTNEEISLKQLEDLLLFTEKTAWMDAFQVPYGKVLTTTKKWIQDHKEYPETIKNGLIRLYNAMIGRPMYGRGTFLKRIDELLLFFSVGLDIIPDRCAWYPHLSTYFSEHDASLLVWKKLWGEAVKASSFKMPRAVQTIMKDAAVLASPDQLRKDTTFLLNDFVTLDWHRITKESETLAVAALWVAQGLQIHESSTIIMEIATKAATQEYGGILSPKLLKVAVSVLISLGNKMLLPQLLTLQNGLRQKSYRTMISSELEGFATSHGIPPEFITEMLLSLQAPATLPAKAIQAAKISLERWYIQEKAISYVLFQEIFLASPLWNELLQGLIFIVNEGQQHISFMVYEQKLLTITDEKMQPSDKSTVQLWHPANASEQEQTAYKMLLKKLKTKQLFKQVDREFFTSKTLSELELPLPQRVLKQKIFRTLARLRGWDAPMISAMFFAGLPTLHLEKRKTDIVLTAKPYGQKDGELLFIEKLAVESEVELPKLVVSEILRDIALFQTKAGVL